MNNKFKFSTPHRMKNFNCLMGHILYQIFKITLNISLKNMKKKLPILK